MSEIAFCIAEDRSENEAGVRLAVLSLCRHMPGVPVYVYRPDPDSRFGPWVARFPQVHFIPSTPSGANSWNCKPQALEPLLDKGYRQVIWVDSDIIVTRDCRPMFTPLDDAVFAATQEPASLPCQGTEIRTRGWNLEVGRRIPFTLNSAVLRVTQKHRPLIHLWRAFLQDPRYVAAQQLPLEQRPVHLMGDQDLLNAALGSREFSNVPLYVLRSGKDIIHAGGGIGYSVSERLSGLLRSKPTFLHATAGKPWLWLGGQPYWSQQNFFSWHRRLLQEISPYLAEARRYARDLGEDPSWMYKRTVLGVCLRVLGCGHFALRGLPVTMGATLLDAAGKLRRRIRAAEPAGDRAARAV